MPCEFDNNFYLVDKMPLITSQSENADGTIIALVAFIVARTLRGLRKWAVQSLNQKRSSMGACYALVQVLGLDDKTSWSLAMNDVMSQAMI